MRIFRAWMLAVLINGGAIADDLFVAVDTSTLRLRSDVVVADKDVRLADVLDFSAADVRLRDALAGELLFDEPGAAPQQAVAHEQVVARLDRLGVNLARVLVVGAAHCRITIQAAEPPPQAADDAPNAASESAADSAPLLRTGAGASLAGSASPAALTLADALRAFVASETSRLSSEIELEFERAGQEFLALSNPPWEFQIRSPAGEKLGLREFMITLRRDGVTHRTVRLLARVKMLRSVVVARRPLSVGVFVKPDDVALEQRLFDGPAKEGFEQTQAVIGQHVKRFLQPGEMLRRTDLKPVELVKRSRPVTVLGADRGVQLRLSGTALESGVFGERVRVRLGESRREQREVRGVVTGVGQVQLEEGA